MQQINKEILRTNVSQNFTLHIYTCFKFDVNNKIKFQNYGSLLKTTGRPQ